MKNIFYKLKAIELSIVVYIFLTSLLIIFSQKYITNEGYNLIIRVSILTILSIFVFFKNDNLENSRIQTVRLFWPILLLGFFYTETDYLNNIIFETNLDPIFVKIEQLLFGVQPSENFSQLLPYNLFAEVMYFGYFSYYLLIIGLPVFIYFKLGFKVTERVIFTVVNSFLIYYLIFIIFPVVGPQFYFENSTQNLPQGYIFGWLIRTIQYYGEAPTAAFPSSHVSICLMLVWFCFKYVKKLLIIVIPIAILLILSTVYLKAHYVIDVLAAFIITPLIYIISSKLFSYFTLILKQDDNNN